MKSLQVTLRTDTPLPDGNGKIKIKKATLEITSEDGTPFDLNIDGSFTHSGGRVMGLGKVSETSLFVRDTNHGLPAWVRVHMAPDSQDDSTTEFVGKRVEAIGFLLDELKEAAKTKPLISPDDESKGAPALIAKFSARLCDPKNKIKFERWSNSELILFQTIDFSKVEDVKKLIEQAQAPHNEKWNIVHNFGQNPTIRAFLNGHQTFKDNQTLSEWLTSNPTHMFAKGLEKK